MTSTSRVWGDVLRRLQNEIPDFAFEAWIAPLAAKKAGDRLLLGCPTSFHRDRVRKHYAAHIVRCWQSANSDPKARLAAAGGGDGSRSDEATGPGSATGIPCVEFLTMKEFQAAMGQPIDLARECDPARTLRQRSPMRRVRADSTGREASIASTVGAPRTSSEGGRIAPSAPTIARRSGATTIDSAPSTSPSSPGTLRPVPARPKRAMTPKGATASRSPSRPDDPRGFDREQDGGGATQTELPFSFESFIVGPCNALAREAALALARQRQRSLNQLYLGGGSGMGKTHLARATAAEARRHLRTPDADRFSPSTRRDAPAATVYTTAEQFTSDFVSAMRLGRSEEWKRRYRGRIGLLVVEDVQFFSGRMKTQLELFHTVQHVLDAGGRVLLTGDRAPADLTGLDERMRAQVGRGFVAELEMPDALVRRHILRSKAAAGGFRLPEDCLDLLVESTAGSVRDIEGTLIQVVTTASLLGRAIDLELTRDAIAMKSGVRTSLAPRRLSVPEIVGIVASFFGMRPEALAGRSRKHQVLVPRQLAMYLAHRYTDASFSEIGHALGRNHPSVRNAISRIERQVLENAPLRYQVEALSERIDQTVARRREGSVDGPALRDR